MDSEIDAAVESRRKEGDGRRWQRAARGGMFYVTAALAVGRSIPHSSTYLADLICAPATEAVSIGQSPSYSQRFHDTLGIGIL